MATGAPAAPPAGAAPAAGGGGGGGLETGAFSIGERVLVPFTDKDYEAKILKAEYRHVHGAADWALETVAWGCVTSSCKSQTRCMQPS